MTDPRDPNRPQPDSVIPEGWPSDTSPEADAPPPTQPGPAGAETDGSGETDEAGVGER